MRVGFGGVVIFYRIDRNQSQGLRGACSPLGGKRRPLPRTLPRTFAKPFPWRTIGRGIHGQKGRAMTGPIETYRVKAYNAAKLSENKIHDDTVAHRFGFSGGLVPGVDVMAYMMHLPVAKWGRGFLERGLIEARFVKPVYDGEITDISSEETGGVVSIEVISRGELCATGSASLPAAAPSLSLSDFSAVVAVTERK